MIGVIRYYGKIKMWSLRGLIKQLHFRLAKWALNKYKRFKGSYSRTYQWIDMVRASYPNMFYHWAIFR
jgi:hypothetical protein